MSPVQRCVWRNDNYCWGLSIQRSGDIVTSSTKSPELPYLDNILGYKINNVLAGF